MAEKKVPTQTEAVEQVNQISADSGLNAKDKPTMVDPIVYRDYYKTEDITEGRDPKKLNNANMNLSQYGDDSSSNNYNQTELRGGQNQKYTGENTKNSQVAYNANATLEGLDPNYKYGQAAQMANSEQANYIARRNDEIASALYNAGKTSMEDVANFLNQQEGFRNSYENERQNTIISIWKRLGDIASNNQQSETPTTTPNEEAVSNMEQDLNQSTAGEIYGKVTADQNTGIQTLEDANSVYKAMNAARVQSFKDLQLTSSDAIAAAIVSGSIASDSQQMRDLMQYDPAKYQEIKNAEKQLRAQMNINSITTGEGEWNTSATNGSSTLDREKTDFAANNANSQTSTAEILKSVDQSLSSNEAASTAKEQMATIEADMATLQNRMKNLKREANSVFKGDVPQYIVSAYMANRTQEIQDQLSILENRYNAAYSRYQQEWEETKRAAEYDLKKQELEIKREQAKVNNWATEQRIMIDWSKIRKDTDLSEEEIMQTFDNFVSTYTEGQQGGQCGAFIKSYLRQLGINLPNISSLENKKALIDTSISEPTEGDIVIMTSPTYPSNGHMAIISSIDDDGTIHLLESNRNGDEKVHTTRTVKQGDSSILGYYRPQSAGSKSSSSDNGDGYYNPNYSEIYGKFLQGKFSAGNQLEKTAKGLGISIDELRNQANARKDAQANNIDVTSKLDALEMLIGQDVGRTGRITSQYTAVQYANGNLADFDAAYNFIKDNITFDKLVDLKKNGATFGALSDNELRAIGNAAVKLNRNLTDKDFYTTLTYIYNELLRGIGRNETYTTEQIKNLYNSKQGTGSATFVDIPTGTGNANSDLSDLANM